MKRQRVADDTSKHICKDCRWYRPDQQQVGECSFPLPFWIMDRMDPPGVRETDGGDCQCFDAEVLTPEERERLAFEERETEERRRFFGEHEGV